MASSSMPNHRMTSGISARCGMLRSICSVLSVSVSLRRDRPLSMPKHEAEAAADGEAGQRAPGADLDVAQQLAGLREPPAGRDDGDRRRQDPRQPADGMRPARAAAAQRHDPGQARDRGCAHPVMAGPTRMHRAAVGYAGQARATRLVSVAARLGGRAAEPADAAALAMPPSAERRRRGNPAPRRLARRADAELREQQLGDAVGLLQMRIARGDDRLDPQRLVFPQARRHGLRAADERGADAAPHQPDAGPEVRADLQPVAPAAVQAVIAAAGRRNRSPRAARACAAAMVSSRGWLISRSAASQASSSVSRTMRWTRSPKFTCRPCAAARARTASSFSATCAGGSPQVR